MAAKVLGSRDRALGFIQKNGPVIPIQISREIGVDTMLAGAILSELVNEGKLNVSEHLRVGGSPVYYINGQEARLENYIKHLNENDIRTLQRLREKGVLRDSECSPLQRVSFRIVKDFAKSLILKKDDGEKIVFWRYYLVNEDAAKRKILDMVGGGAKKSPIAPIAVDKFERKDVVKKKEGLSEREIKSSDEVEIIQDVSKIQDVRDRREIRVAKPRIRKDSGFDSLKEFFRVNGVTVWEEKVIRKDKDVNYVISFESKLGNLRYFAKFRDKKRITDGDISLAFNEAGKLPLMFLSSGELTKTAKRLIEGDYKGVVFKRV